MERRNVLRAGGFTLLSALAGCTGLFETRPAGREPPLVENRPDAVYVPTHFEEMQMAGMGHGGSRMVGLTYSYPHRFWTVTGRETKRVDVEGDDAVHMMLSVWDTETNEVLPIESGLQIEIEKDGETVTRLSPWPMLSQRMGFHYGDNVSLDGDGTYAVSVDLGSMGLRRMGSFADRFEGRTTVRVEFDYSESERNDLGYTMLDERKGQKGAVDPMMMEDVPLSFAPKKGDLPGESVGEGTSGDAVFVATAVERDGGPYLAVSPRTPHNRYVLPMMSLSATVARGNETAFDGALTEAIDPELGYHYGAAVDGLRPDDDVTITVDAPPQVSRHEGYETAFLDMPEVTL
ncbi:iron transporter [Halegenticoccus soli]|uniref:iron transporter n=1 Tax=Halegenticoccus soli TaxID=1985678 RepID=UPI000C6D7369|nr:iron transporter [Halegenticoccus soli]